MSTPDKQLRELLGLEAKICDLHRWAHIAHMMVVQDIDSPKKELGSLGLAVVEHMENLARDLEAAFYAGVDRSRAG